MEKYRAEQDRESAEHVPVLLDEAVSFLAPHRGGLFVDCTLGLGGHTAALLASDPAVRVVAIDRDPQALEIAQRRLREYQGRCQFVHGDFRELDQLLDGLGVASVAGIFADLGVSSLQLDRAARGFSFRHDGPLDMRMDPATEIDAAAVVATYSEAALSKVIHDFGEERFARRIARAIVRERESERIESTNQLADVVRKAIPRRPRRGRRPARDPATKTFQALRIEVNRELSGLEQMLESSLSLLESEGRLVVISYHSLEDRIVKTSLRSAALGEVDPVTGRARSETRLIELLTKKPVNPGAVELDRNRRSRSARLRAARRL